MFIFCSFFLFSAFYFILFIYTCVYFYILTLFLFHFFPVVQLPPGGASGGAPKTVGGCCVPLGLPQPLLLEEKKFLLAVERGDIPNVRRWVPSHDVACFSVLFVFALSAAKFAPLFSLNGASGDTQVSMGRIRIRTRIPQRDMCRKRINPISTSPGYMVCTCLCVAASVCMCFWVFSIICIAALFALGNILYAT